MLINPYKYTNDMSQSDVYSMRVAVYQRNWKTKKRDQPAILISGNFPQNVQKKSPGFQNNLKKRPHAINCWDIIPLLSFLYNNWSNNLTNQFKNVDSNMIVKLNCVTFPRQAWCLCALAAPDSPTLLWPQLFVAACRQVGDRSEQKSNSDDGWLYCTMTSVTEFLP